jgi:hypothetical protein
MSDEAVEVLADEAVKLTRLKADYAEKQKVAAEAKAEADQQEDHLLEVFKRSRQESCRPLGVGVTFTAVFDKERGRLTDRKAYFEWAMDTDPALLELADDLSGDAGYTPEQVLHRVKEALQSLTILKLSERQELLNRQVRKAHEEEPPAPLPPGLDYDPVPYVSVTKA